MDLLSTTPWHQRIVVSPPVTLVSAKNVNTPQRVQPQAPLLHVCAQLNSQSEWFLSPTGSATNSICSVSRKADDKGQLVSMVWDTVQKLGHRRSLMAPTSVTTDSYLGVSEPYISDTACLRWLKLYASNFKDLSYSMIKELCFFFLIDNPRVHPSLFGLGQPKITKCQPR